MKSWAGTAYLLDSDCHPFFIEDRAVAEMLQEGILFVIEDDLGLCTVMINCNGVWVPGADDEPLRQEDIEPLYWASCSPKNRAVGDWLCERYGHTRWREVVEQNDGHRG
jgi:hypothetical protein